jgi:UDP-glucose 4-epimerase
MKNKILVTGGAGYIGSHTVRYLLTQNIAPENILVFDNLVYGHEDVIPPGVTFIKGDLLNKSDIMSVFEKYEIESVIHFAAYAYVGESMTNPFKYFENNIVGGLNLLNSMVQHNCHKIIFSSTCATYGMPDKTPIDEQEKQHPINAYGESKLMFEKILEWFGKIHKVKSVRLRYFNAAGAGYGIGERHDPETHLIPLVLETAKGTLRSIKVFGDDYVTPDGTCIRDYIHVIDLAAAHHKALQYLENDDVVTDYFNLGTGKGCSVKEIIDLSKRITCVDFQVDVEDRRPGDPDILVADPTKANDILGWKAEYDIEKIITSAWEFHKNN